MWKAAAAVIVVLIGAVLVYAATRPDTLYVTRSAAINAPPHRIFTLINDYRAWRSWSPYETKDPAMKRTLGGASAGKGATYAWAGDKNVGRGRMEITESVPPSRISIKLDFDEPFEAHNIVDFTLVPRGAATDVTWAMRGPMPFVSKLMSIFVDMDEMIGADFEAGLGNLKAVAEKQP